jgi:3-hydroxyisobutyrate dehydrogenase-like beta-hydroxyacid dehydrogenase
MATVMMNQSVGVVGTGVLGSAMAVVLIESGFEVVAFDIDPAKLEALGARGVISAASARDVADRTEAIVTCLPSVEAMHDAVSGADGIARSAGGGHIVIETSTVPVAEKECARDDLAAVGKTMLDCPVSGNRILALQKKLTAFGSGDRAAYDKVEHVIRGFAGAAYYIGPFGDGLRMKFVGNILNLVHNSVAAEVMVLGMKSGLDPKVIHKVISGSGSSSGMFEVRGAMMAENDYRKEGMNFSVPLKDARIIADHAASLLCPIPIYQAALQPYYAAVAQGHRDEDASAVCAALELAANCEREKDGT